MQQVAIIGGGAAGTLVAMQLIRQAHQPLQIRIFDQAAQFQTGVAYAPSDFSQLLNVAASRMSAWPEQSNHFVEWVQQQPAYCAIDTDILAQSYLPRSLYGQYLKQQWQLSLSEAAGKGIEVALLPVAVTRLQILPAMIALTHVQGDEQFHAVVIATGNELPRHPLPPHSGLTDLPGYQQNPWCQFAIKSSPAHNPCEQTSAVPPQRAHCRVLILGNGLTMVDTVLALRQQGVRCPIISLSPHGYGMLPHRQALAKAPDLGHVFAEKPGLRQVLRLFNTQRKQWRQLGVSAEGLVDSLRPYSQQLWSGFSNKEKQLFFKKLRHLWGVARHRLPMQIHDQIQQLRLQGALEVKAGSLLRCQATAQGIDIWMQLKGHSEPEYRQVDRIINCTGPEHNFTRLPSHFLAKAIADQWLAVGPLDLGLAACPTTFALKNATGTPYSQLFGIGSVLRGELWETTALNEIRQQAKQVATQILQLA